MLLVLAQLCPNLQKLNVGQTLITDAGLVSLSHKCTRIEVNFRFVLQNRVTLHQIHDLCLCVCVEYGVSGACCVWNWCWRRRNWPGSDQVFSTKTLGCSFNQSHWSYYEHTRGSMSQKFDYKFESEPLWGWSRFHCGISNHLATNENAPSHFDSCGELSCLWPCTPLHKCWNIVNWRFESGNGILGVVGWSWPHTQETELGRLCFGRRNTRHNCFSMPNLVAPQFRSLCQNHRQKCKSHLHKMQRHPVSLPQLHTSGWQGTQWLGNWLQTIACFRHARCKEN